MPKPESCIICDATRSLATGHQWRSPTCTEPQKCIICGETNGKPLGHIWEKVNGLDYCKKCGIGPGQGSADGRGGLYRQTL